jgi:hypothetical protein
MGEAPAKRTIPSSLDFSTSLHFPPFHPFSTVHQESPAVASVANDLPNIPYRFTCSTVQTMPRPQSNPPAILFGIEL